VQVADITKSKVSYPLQQDELDGIVALARDGDRQAFNRLVLRYQDVIVNLCISLMGNRCDGEDAAQETFVKAFEQMNLFRGEAKFSTWLHTIAVNSCRNRHQSFWHKLFRKSVSIGSTGIDEDESESVDIVDSSMLPNQVLERKELQGQIKGALLNLPVRFRELIVLREIRQLSYAEIAVILKVPEGTVKSGIARARLALQAEFKGIVDGI
jgi:RNA polymerase sigma-70 factor, ECF subfamily